MQTLDQLYDEFSRVCFHSNPGEASCEIFDAWLIEHGIDPAEFSEDTWFDFLERRFGMTGEEAMEYLAGAAEWQI
jgi:hypothetical protein